MQKRTNNSHDCRDATTTTGVDRRGDARRVDRRPVVLLLVGDVEARQRRRGRRARRDAVLRAEQDVPAAGRVQVPRRQGQRDRGQLRRRRVRGRLSPAAVQAQDPLVSAARGRAPDARRADLHRERRAAEAGRLFRQRAGQVGALS